MTINGPHDIEEGDHIYVGKGCPDALRGTYFRVSDVQVKDIGITETFTVSLVSAPESMSNYAIVGTTADSQVTFIEIGGPGEHPIFWQHVEFHEE